MSVFPLPRVLGCLAAALLLVAPVVANAQPELAPPGPAPVDSGAAPAEEPGVETLTQGPIHEAFANPADLDPTPGPVVAKQPPADVPEDPPEYMPEGAIWIPGYWSWDDDRDDFIWVTGVARVPPPGQRWVPGYFTEADGGWQRVSGFWVGDEATEVDYRPTAPPTTLDVGPSSPAPADNYFWIPGNWNYYDTGYHWQAGYWAPYQENWIWVPARWVWTPAGFVFCPGYWDYRLAYRGQMFAPVYFTSAVYTRPNWAYRPWCVIPTQNLFIHLWLRPRWNCYYFGNYYGAQFASRGFLPWANLTVVTRQRYVYDPFYAYARVHYRRQGVDYLNRVQGWHHYYAQHADLRPARTWQEQQRVVHRAGAQHLETQLVARNLTEVARRQDAPIRLTHLDEQKQRSQKQHAEKIRELDSERKKLERTAGQTAARLPARPGASDVERDREKSPASKSGSLVDRAEKGGKTAGDHVTGGKASDGKAAAGEHHGPKLSLPKTDLPAVAVATSQASGDRPSAKTGPPPKPAPVARAGDDRGERAGNLGRGTKGKGAPARSADSKTPTVGQPALPGAVERHPADRATTGRNLPGADREKGGKVPNRAADLPQVDRPGRPAELPKVDQPPRANPLPRAGRPESGPPPTNNLPGARERVPKAAPGVDLPAPRSDLPRTAPRAESPGRQNEPPRPKAAIPRTEIPRTEIPRTEIPRANPQGDRGGNRNDPRSRGGQKGPPPTNNRIEARRLPTAEPPGSVPTTRSAGSAPAGKGKSKGRDNEKD